MCAIGYMFVHNNYVEQISECFWCLNSTLGRSEIRDVSWGKKLLLCLLVLLLIALNCFPEVNNSLAVFVYFLILEMDQRLWMEGRLWLIVISDYQIMSSGLVLSCAFLSIESVTDYHIKSCDYLLLDGFQYGFSIGDFPHSSQQSFGFRVLLCKRLLLHQDTDWSVTEVWDQK